MFPASCDRSRDVAPSSTLRSVPENPATATATGDGPHRIISISPNATEIIAALGAADRLVAVSDFCVWPPEVRGLPRVGGLFDARLETIMSLRPDLVVLRGGNRGVEQLCENGGIRLYRDRTESLADIERTLLELGDLLHCRERAEAARDGFRQRLDRIRDRWSRAKGAGGGPRVLVTLARDPTAIAAVMVGARGTFIDDMISAAGGVNVFADTATAYPSVSQEAILATRPEVIVELLPESPPSVGLEAKMRAQWKELGPLPAVESGRVFVLFDENAMIPSPRIVEVVEKLARLFHPEIRFD